MSRLALLAFDAQSDIAGALQTEVIMGFEQHLEAAKKRVAEMDEYDGYKDRELETIVQALKTGLRHHDNQEVFGCAFDALVMLADVANRNDLI